MSYEIKLKRTNKTAIDTKIKDIILKAGEPIYFSSTNQLYVGDGTSSIENLKGTKLVSRSLIDNGLYFSSNDSGTVAVVADTGTTIYPKTRTSSVFSDDGAQDLTTILNNKEPAFVTLPVNKGGTGLSSLPNNSVPMGVTGGTSVALTIDQTITDATTNHLASVKAIANYITSYIDTNKYAGAITAGGPATAVASTPDTTETKAYVLGVTETNGAAKYNTSVYLNCTTGVLMGAAWNDFAEGRDCQEEPGTCVVEVGNGKLVKSNDYCQLGCSVVSDTYGMLIGAEQYENGSPIAVAGRVLAKFDYSKGDPQPGFPVCSAPDGRVALMDRNQVRNWPDAIVGYISEIPTYEEWNGRKVDGRIWIKVK